jgi:hypothetical protein
MVALERRGRPTQKFLPPVGGEPPLEGGSYKLPTSSAQWSTEKMGEVLDAGGAQDELTAQQRADRLLNEVVGMMRGVKDQFDMCGISIRSNELANSISNASSYSNAAYKLSK